MGGGALGYLSLRQVKQRRSLSDHSSYHSSRTTQDDVGSYARKVGEVAAGAANAVKEKDAELGVSANIKAKLPGGGGEGLSYAEIKKFGVSGTVAYILTELAFWAIAFPVSCLASTRVGMLR